MRYRLTFITGAAVGYVLGARAGRERYEELRKGARRIAQNPAVRNTAETAAVNGRALVTRTFDKVGDRLPGPVGERFRSLRERGQGDEDDWGTSNT
ncbi:YtxH domain-containing protein [Streptomyces sp. UNOB3_S3]|uniref:YtxH domain-containing protein n=1 Tax=Streptomyces sp. UNOB3_S3 TaxID=2871682 RepID=UPI001E29BF9A|nr:YtxH domain-containing protein [Streptomyces sp. UNOB3_S3]MCC3778356.1 YtxH domain-containing protein [Streptomyces sp. UNOB3_S3]